jgi:hypothetical protein
MNFDVIKKALYKEKPTATFVMEVKREGVNIYKAELSIGRVAFSVPADESRNFSKTEPAQLLCRWISQFYPVENKLQPATAGFEYKAMGMDFGLPEGNVSVTVACVTDSDGHWYWIPFDRMEEFMERSHALEGRDYMESPDLYDTFSYRFESYRTLGDTDLKPQIFENLQVEISNYELRAK